MSGGVFSGNFIDQSPQFTAQAVYNAFNNYYQQFGSTHKEYWLCTWASSQSLFEHYKKEFKI
jgi:hypothetical protein